MFSPIPSTMVWQRAAVVMVVAAIACLATNFFEG